MRNWRNGEGLAPPSPSPPPLSSPPSPPLPPPPPPFLYPSTLSHPHTQATEAYSPLSPHTHSSLPLFHLIPLVPPPFLHTHTPTQLLSGPTPLLAFTPHSPLETLTHIHCLLGPSPSHIPFLSPPFKFTPTHISYFLPGPHCHYPTQSDLSYFF